MGWSKGEIDGREVGYSVEAACDEPGCAVQITRGVSYACGGDHGDGVPEGETAQSCTGYFCAEHEYTHADCALALELSKPCTITSEDTAPNPSRC